MYPEVTMIRGAVKTQIHAERHRRPGWILLSTIEAYLFLLDVGYAILDCAHLVCLFRFELLEDLLRLQFCSTHVDRNDMYSESVGPVDDVVKRSRCFLDSLTAHITTKNNEKH